MSFIFENWGLINLPVNPRRWKRIPIHRQSQRLSYAAMSLGHFGCQSNVDAAREQGNAVEPVVGLSECPIG